jgi:hypothetical protein
LTTLNVDAIGHSTSDWVACGIISLDPFVLNCNSGARQPQLAWFFRALVDARPCGSV